MRRIYWLVSQKNGWFSEATDIKTYASDEGKAEGSVFLFGVQIKKYFRSLRLQQPMIGKFAAPFLLTPLGVCVHKLLQPAGYVLRQSRLHVARVAG